MQCVCIMYSGIAIVPCSCEDNGFILLILPSDSYTPYNIDAFKFVYKKIYYIINSLVPGKVTPYKPPQESVNSARYPRRDRPVKNYTEIDEPEDDDYLRMYQSLRLTYRYTKVCIICYAHYYCYISYTWHGNSY